MSVRPKLTLERTYRASPEDVWELWTTKDGIEAWWGPDGFTVSVHQLDLRPGGELLYAMSATGAEQIDYMRKAGMPLTTQQRVIYTEVTPPRRLCYRDVVDFVPGVERYEVETLVELSPVPEGTRLVVRFDRMHDEQWTRMAVMGRESELERLTRLLAARS